MIIPTLSRRTQHQTVIIKETIGSLPSKKDSDIYISELKKADEILHGTKKHCRRMIFLTVLFIIAQLELCLPNISHVYEYVSMPIYTRFLYALSSIAHHWLIILIAFALIELLVWWKQPEVWNHLLLKGPIIKKIMLPLYSYRYHLTKKFGGNHENAIKATRNSAFSLESGSMAMEQIRDSYPLLYTAIEIEQTSNDMTNEDKNELCKYTMTLLEEASFDVKECVSYTCMGVFLVITFLLVFTYVATHF